jgi:hypothetical protein
MQLIGSLLLLCFQCCHWCYANLAAAAFMIIILLLYAAALSCCRSFNRVSNRRRLSHRLANQLTVK